MYHYSQFLGCKEAADCRSTQLPPLASERAYCRWSRSAHRHPWNWPPDKCRKCFYNTKQINTASKYKCCVFLVTRPYLENCMFLFCLSWFVSKIYSYFQNIIFKGPTEKRVSFFIRALFLAWSLIRLKVNGMFLSNFEFCMPAWNLLFWLINV